MKIKVWYIEHEVWWHENGFRVLTIETPYRGLPKETAYYL